MTNTLLALVMYYANMYGVNPHLALSVIQVESGFNHKAVGLLGEIGLMQLRPEYVDKSVNLFDPEINIKLGIKKLADVKKSCYHKKNKTFVICYNLGVKGGSRIKYPYKFSYYKKVIAAYKHIGERMRRDITGESYFYIPYKDGSYKIYPHNPQIAYALYETRLFINQLVERQKIDSDWKPVW